jgi:prepilin-type N-terminal cleavage/methylation domain-containing protein
MRHFVNTPHGLTLVELMIVLAVSGLLLGGTWQLYHSSLQAYRHGLQEVRMALGARTVLRLMSRDMQNALASAVPYGIQGSHLLQTGAARADGLMLTTTVDTPPGVQTIQYYLEPTTGEGRLALKRAILGGEERTIQRVMPLNERLYDFNVRYFDGQIWYDAWQRADLPRALEITLLFQSTGRTAQVYRFTAMVVME